MSSVKSFELPSDYIFQQDNDSKHSAKSWNKSLSENNVNILQKPSESLIWIQLETCGNFWKLKSDKWAPANINNLKTIYQEEWYKIPTNYCKKLIEN